MRLIFLDWVNWRVIRGEYDISLLLYALLFAGVLWLVIQWAEWAFKKFRNKSK